MYENTYEDIIKAQNGDKNAMASLINNNIGLVYNIVKRFYSRGYEKEDLEQIGTIGLIKSIKKFKPQYGVKLSTYAVPFILGEIKRFIRDDGKIKISRSLKELAQKIYQIQREYMQTKGIELKIEEIAQILNISKEEAVMALDAMSSVISINAYMQDDENNERTIESTIKSSKDEMQEIVNKLTIEKTISQLSTREQQIVKLRYFKQYTQSQVAKILGISQVQVSRLEKEILLRMKEKIIS